MAFIVFLSFCALFNSVISISITAGGQRPAGEVSAKSCGSLTKIAFGSGIICYNSCCQCKLKLCHAVNSAEAATQRPLDPTTPRPHRGPGSWRSNSSCPASPQQISISRYSLFFFCFSSFIIPIFLIFMSFWCHRNCCPAPSCGTQKKKKRNVAFAGKISKHKWIFKLPSWQSKKIESKIISVLWIICDCIQLQLVELNWIVVNIFGYSYLCAE